MLNHTRFTSPQRLNLLPQPYATSRIIPDYSDIKYADLRRFDRLRLLLNDRYHLGYATEEEMMESCDTFDNLDQWWKWMVMKWESTVVVRLWNDIPSIPSKVRAYQKARQRWYDNVGIAITLPSTGGRRFLWLHEGHYFKPPTPTTRPAISKRRRYALSRARNETTRTQAAISAYAPVTFTAELPLPAPMLLGHVQDKLISFEDISAIASLTLFAHSPRPGPVPVIATYRAARPHPATPLLAISLVLTGLHVLLSKTKRSSHR